MNYDSFINERYAMALDGLKDREKDIVRLIAQDTAITVSQISKELALSTVAVRSHLDKLEKKGILHRNHGGAVLAFHPEIVARQNDRTDAKTRIAEAAAALVNDGDTIMMNSSTTVAPIARYFLGQRDIRIVTNSTLVLPFARINPRLQLNLIGGTFRPETEAMVGPFALRELNDYHAKFAFIGTAGFGVENGVTSHLADEADVVRKFAERSDTTILVADSSKYGRAGFVRFLEMSQIHKLVTDSELSDVARQQLINLGIDVIIA